MSNTPLRHGDRNREGRLVPGFIFRVTDRVVFRSPLSAESHLLPTRLTSLVSVAHLIDQLAGAVSAAMVVRSGPRKAAECRAAIACCFV